MREVDTPKENIEAASTTIRADMINRITATGTKIIAKLALNTVAITIEIAKSEKMIGKTRGASNTKVKMTVASALEKAPMKNSARNSTNEKEKRKTARST